MFTLPLGSYISLRLQRCAQLVPFGHGSVSVCRNVDALPPCSVTSTQVGDVLTPRVNYARRLGLAQHHTATHLLGVALKQVLLQEGENGKKDEALRETDKRTIQQKGSLVEERRLRFDFDWDGPLTSQQIESIELHVQRAVSCKSYYPLNSNPSRLDAHQSLDGNAVFSSSRISVNE